MEEYFDQLNENQRAAVVYTDGPSLVIAGAGSGKTRVLTYKIAYLLQKGIPPYSILALTFTNKAAREMKERISSLVGEQVTQRLWMGTFHSIFSRILRYEAEYIGYSSNFTIYDAADSKSLIRTIIKEMQLDDKIYKVNLVQGRISNAKNALITAQSYAQNKELIDLDFRAKMPFIREIYQRYENRCKQAGAMDFDDLLLQTNILFRDHSAILEKYRKQFQYILVDEYQDTNFAQHLIIQKLSEQNGHLTVVGDDAQSIYSFRGANIDNMLQIKTIYPDLCIFKLERNYRSTQNIVNAANSLIYKNKKQIHKTVYSEKEEGEKVGLFASYSDYEEAYAVVSKIGELRKENDYNYSDFAILYRTNAQSRILEEAFRKRNIPYKIYGGLSFYQRKEIKDVIAYFRLIINPHDEEALKRIINYPGRGIGDTTVNKLISVANKNNVSLWSALREPYEYGMEINKGTAKKLADFRDMILSFITYTQNHSAVESAVYIITHSGIAQVINQDLSVEGVSKKENLNELTNGIAAFVQLRQEEGIEYISLADFLSEVVLLTDQDNDREEQTNKVTMMTIHAAKGLEFKNVFIVGIEDNLFPSQMSHGNDRAIEEERRLFYVAITRAQENCILSHAKSRFRNGKMENSTPSRFLKDIDQQYLNLPRESSFQSTGFDQERRQNKERSVFQSPFQQRQPKEESSNTVMSPRMRKLEPEQKIASTTSPCSETYSGNLKIGSHVSHDRFGEGEVTAIEGEGGNVKATVIFNHFGKKQLLLKFAKLTILS